MSDTAMLWSIIFCSLLFVIKFFTFRVKIYKWTYTKQIIKSVMIYISNFCIINSKTKNLIIAAIFICLFSAFCEKQLLLDPSVVQCTLAWYLFPMEFLKKCPITCLWGQGLGASSEYSVWTKR